MEPQHQPFGQKSTLAKVGIVGMFVLTSTQLGVALTSLLKWPWFHPEPSLVRSPPGGLGPLQWVVLGLMAASFGVRIARLRAARRSIGQEVFADIGVGVGLGALMGYTLLGSASVWCFDLIESWGVGALAVYGAIYFISGWAPGFNLSTPIFAAIAFGHPGLLLWGALPATVGDLLEVMVRRDVPRT